MGSGFRARQRDKVGRNHTIAKPSKARELVLQTRLWSTIRRFTKAPDPCFSLLATGSQVCSALHNAGPLWSFVTGWWRPKLFAIVSWRFSLPSLPAHLPCPLTRNAPREPTDYVSGTSKSTPGFAAALGILGILGCCKEHLALIPRNERPCSTQVRSAVVQSELACNRAGQRTSWPLGRH